MRVMRLAADELDGLLDEVRHRGGVVRFSADIWGTSMAPEIGHGDRILVESAQLEQISTGDVVVYLGSHGRKVAHRVVGVDGCDEDAALVIRSDAPSATEEMVDRDRLIGRVVGVERASPWNRIIVRAHTAVSRLLRKAGIAD